MLRPCLNSLGRRALLLRRHASGSPNASSIPGVASGGGGVGARAGAAAGAGGAGTGASEQPLLLRHRGALLFAVGFFFGGGGLTGVAVLQWNSDAAAPPAETKQERRRRKAEAKLAAMAADTAACSGRLQRRGGWFGGWQYAEAEVVAHRDLRALDLPLAALLPPKRWESLLNSP